MALDGWKAKVAVFFFKGVVLFHDIVTIPFYFLIHKPWRIWKLKNTIWAKLENKDDPYGCYTRQVTYGVSNGPELETMDQLFQNSVSQYGNRKCYGIRDVFGEEEETSKSGKVLKKLRLGNYKWLTYNEVNERVINISKGLLNVGIESRKKIVLLSETRVEFLLTAQACFRINVPVVTLYANLGDDGLVHGINETEVTHIVTSYDLLQKLKAIIHRTPKVTHIIYMEGVNEKINFQNALPSNVTLLPYKQLEESGKKCSNDTFTPSSSDDLAVLMYTSGSTGIPKGVMLSQKNVMTTVKGFSNVLNKHVLSLDDKDTYIAYLPAAHIMELAAECYLTSLGVKIGYSSPQTLTDYSTAVKKGENGDIKVLKPTIFIAVPLMLDRVRKSIVQLAGKENSFPRLMFDFAVSYKKFWSNIGFQTPRLDRKLLKQYRDFLGGEIRIVVCGSAPLSPDTQTFIRDCLSVRILQGYGLTETCLSATIMDYNDCSIGRVGAPLSTCKFRLTDWKEGNYSVKDKPNPRGEIVLGGDFLAAGYFKNKAQTEEAFKIENGVRWFFTGDIGEVFPDGTVKIIDRKKDLIKLQFGEYIALGKVEAELKTYPLIENICVVGSGFHSYLVALVLPSFVHLKSIAKEFGRENMSFEEMCSDREIIKEVTERLREFGKKCGLFGSELPKKLKLCSDEWSPESGLVTAALKIRRKYIENHYKAFITAMFSETTVNGPNTA